MKTKRFIPALISAVLVLSLMFCACGTGGNDATTTAANTTAAPSQTNADENTATKIGTGATEFTFTIVDAQGTETEFLIATDETVVGEALKKLGLISGDEGDYGLYVKTVNGITADYDTHGTYWAFYIDGAYATAGVDQTTIEAGHTYTFKIEK